MSWQFNSNGKDFQTFDTYLGKATKAAIGNSIGGFPGIVYGTLEDKINPTTVGTAVRYGLGGGMDTFTFKDGSKAHHFSDGDEILTDKNGKYIGSVYTSWP